jgi:membrane-bound acyltransferase YfiQ involved in biofilm formation
LPKAVDYVAQKKFIHKISGFSYEIYLIHSLTLAGAVNIFDFIDNKVMANIISLLVTFFSAWILKICSNNVIKKLK